MTLDRNGEKLEKILTKLTRNIPRKLKHSGFYAFMQKRIADWLYKLPIAYGLVAYILCLDYWNAR